jgi:uncharacterized protein
VIETLSQPWPWYVAGPLIGIMVPLLLLLGNRLFGFSSNLRTMCAAVLPTRAEYFRFDWKSAGTWNLAFLLGTVLGAAIAALLLGAPTPDISATTQEQLTALGLQRPEGLVPAEVFSWSSLLTIRGFVSIVVGGFLVGFGTAYAGGCTSGHGITGLATLQLASLIAVIGFFAGGLLGTFVVLPLLL